ncbi:hypothetical protein [Methylocystis sp.]|uniref:hypothetical protein n=1 Tax=Methylocystis sp. TaxID=1911079 RepID=UPI0025F6FF22|nr:hypothetical protein [Methylocystis sp.]
MSKTEDFQAIVSAKVVMCPKPFEHTIEQTLPGICPWLLEVNLGYRWKAFCRNVFNKEFPRNTSAFYQEVY